MPLLNIWQVLGTPQVAEITLSLSFLRRKVSNKQTSELQFIPYIKKT